MNCAAWANLGCGKSAKFSRNSRALCRSIKYAIFLDGSASEDELLRRVRRGSRDHPGACSCVVHAVCSACAPVQLFRLSHEDAEKAPKLCIMVTVAAVSEFVHLTQILESQCPSKFAK